MIPYRSCERVGQREGVSESESERVRARELKEIYFNQLVDSSFATSDIRGTSVQSVQVRFSLW